MMAVSLYDLSVANYLQTLGGVEGFLGKSIGHFNDNKVDANELEGKDMVFQIRDNKLPFTAEGFLLSFSLPNFYFHATTAYDILRSKGVPIGKRDFLGRMRMKS